MTALDPTTVYLLGAGFSKPAGMPLATELIELLLAQRDGGEMAEWLASVKQRIDWLNHPNRSPAGLNIEQVFHLAHFDIEAHRLKQHLVSVGRVIGPWQDAESIEAWLQYLERSLLDVISERDAGAKLEPITRWAKAVRDTDALVTFNYDTLVERALSQCGREWNHGTGRDGDRGIPVLKLHGSIDWIVADRSESFSKLDLLSAKEHENQPVGKTGHVEDDCRLWRCRDPDQRKTWLQGRDSQAVPNGACVITPGIAGLGAYKELHRVPELGKVWVGAMRAVYKADRLVVVGFSMSDFDGMAQMQFAGAMRAKHAEKRPLSVLVIDPAAKDCALQGRFKRVFHDCVSFVPQTHDAFDWRQVQR